MTATLAAKKAVRDLRPLLFPALAGGLGIATFLLVAPYRRDLEAAWSRLSEVDRRVVPTDWGPVEYAERGFGEPLLVLHGIFGGCDAALLGARDLRSRVSADRSQGGGDGASETRDKGTASGARASGKPSGAVDRHRGCPDPIVRGVLRSPFHPLLGSSLLILTYSGRRTGRRHSLPVMYVRDGNRLIVCATQPERKRWWRNLRRDAPVGVRL